MSIAYFYFMGNKIEVPVLDLGDVSEYTTYYSQNPPTPAEGYNTLNMSTDWGGVFRVKSEPGEPPVSFSASDELNISNTPLYPTRQTSNVSVTFTTQGDWHLYSVNSSNQSQFMFNNRSFSISVPGHVCLAFGYINDERYLGFLLYENPVYPSGTRWAFFYQLGTDDILNVLDELLEYDQEPGEKGFRPTGAYTNKIKPGNGGRGTTNKKEPDYEAHSIAQPGAPDESVASAIGAGFLTCYKIDSANLANMGKNLYSDSMINIIKNMAVNPLDFIVSLMIFPCSPASIGGAQNIKLGGWLCAATGGAIVNALGTNAQGYPLTSQFKVVDFGTLQIPENWGNYLDYSQTTLELYLPFIGSVNLDTSECMGGSINVQYTIDFFTGMCVANVLCTRPNFVLPSGKALNYVNAQHSFQGNCAIQIPLSAVNYGSMIGSLINACTQSITNPVAGFAGIASDAVAGGFRPNVTSKGNIVANSGFCSVLYPYVRITRPITAETESYQEVMGLPSYINTTLGECSDLCVCDEIDLRNVNGATESEISKIRQMCKDGVYV